MSEGHLPGPATKTRPIAVLGAGLTGLTAGWLLRQAGAPVTVFEASDRAGGAIGGIREQGWLHEGGPNTLLEESAEIAALIDAVGLRTRRRYAAAAAKKRFVVRGGRLLAMPDSPLAFLSSRLFSWRAKLGVLGEPFRAARAGEGEESVADFVLRRLGREFLDYAADPFVAGVYAGDPRELSMPQAFPKLYALEKEHRSLFRGAIKRRDPGTAPRGRILSFPDGLEELPSAMAAALGDCLRLSSPVTALARGAGGWRVRFERNGAPSQADFSAVICALPPDALSRLALPEIPAASGLGVLREIVQPPVISIFTGFRRQDIVHPLDGFGFLVPGVEHRRILGTLFSSTLFSGRAPEGHVALTTFVGGTREPELALLKDGTVLEMALAELADLLGLRGLPVITRLRRWQRAIPQYNLGYQRFKDAYSAVEAASPGLFIGGNGRDGISLSACIESGRRLAEAALAGRK